MSRLASIIEIDSVPLHMQVAAFAHWNMIQYVVKTAKPIPTVAPWDARKKKIKAFFITLDNILCVYLF